MARVCNAPVREAVGNAFTDEEIDDVIERLAHRFTERRKALPTESEKEALSRAAAEMTREDVRKQLITRRVAMYRKITTAARATHLDNLPAGMDEGDRLRAYNVGSDRQGLGTSDSVDARGDGLVKHLFGMVDMGLKSLDGMKDRLSNFFGAEESGMTRRLAKEMARLNGDERWAPDDDPGIRGAARVLVNALETGRTLQNAAGAWIPKLEGYIVRQRHDQLKVAGGFWREIPHLLRAGGSWQEASRLASRVAFRTWRDFIEPRLNERTFEGLDALDEDTLSRRRANALELHRAGVLDDPKDLRGLFLYRVWMNVVTGQSDLIGGSHDGQFSGPPGTARATSTARVLHFKDPDAWVDYHEKFGRGSLLAAVFADLQRAGRNTALMERWGPTPEHSFGVEVARLTEQAKVRGDARAIGKIHSYRRLSEFGELTGEAERPESLRFAMIGRMIRMDQTLAKLGSMVLSALGSDQALAAQTFKRVGARFLDGYQSSFAGILRLQGADQRAAADLLDAGAKMAAAHYSSRLATSDGPMGWMSWAMQMFYRANSFDFTAGGQRMGNAAMLSAHMGQQSAFAWDKLEIGFRETLERFGIGARGWDLVRRGAVVADDGRTYLTLDRVSEITDREAWDYGGQKGRGRTAGAAQRVRLDLEMRFRTLVSGVLDDALSEPRARERADLTRGLKPGTIYGEASRAFTQFWSFNQAVMGRHVAPAARGYAGRKPVSLLAHLIVSTALGGYVSLQMKQIAKGRTPRPIFEEDGSLALWQDEAAGHEGRAGSVFLASLLQGGGLGIYGDFLFGEANRNGLGFGISAVGGPAISELESLVQIVRGAVSGDEDEIADVPGDMARLGVRNLPFANLWYSRAALDYLILYRMQEAISPGYLHRYEDRVRREEGSEFFISPTEAVQ